MPPKSSKDSGKERENLIGDEEEVLQAVVLADSFNKRFKPLTTHKPRCLLPVCNAPLLDWTFESLALAGVQEIFVICRSHSELVKAAIKESKWSKPGSGIKIVPIMMAKETYSPGDAMRDIYTRGLVTSDFVLVMGDLVSNVRIDEAVRVHKERRKVENGAIMTMVVKESGGVHRTRSKGESSVFVLDAETSECLHYESVFGYPPKTHVKIPREILAEHPELDIRNDLIDCSIDVCSVEVPSLFQDNFDYLDIRRDFVHGVLTSDLLEKKIYCYVAKEGYAARVKDTKSYDSVSKDILSRWTFPLVPDDNHPAGHLYEHIRGNKYIAKDGSVVLSRTCEIGNNTLIGSGTLVHDNAQIIASVIGSGCSIGPGTAIRDAYIFDGTVVGANCFVERCIIGAGVLIKDDSRVERGCLVGDGVVLGPGARMKPFMRLSKKKGLDAAVTAIGKAPGFVAASLGDEQSGDEVIDNGSVDGGSRADETVEGNAESEVDSDLEEVEARQDGSLSADLGADSNALVWPEALEEDVDEDSPENLTNLRFMRIGDDVSDLDYSDQGSVTGSEDSSDSESDTDELSHTKLSSVASSSTTSLPTPTLESSNLMAESEFHAEVTQSLERAFSEGHSVDNAAVELKTLRMASNVPLSKVREAVIAAIVEEIKLGDGGAAALRKDITRVVGRWGELINKIGGVDAVETVTLLQVHCASSERLPLFGQILAALYQADIVEEDDIRAWHASPISRDGGPKSGSLGPNLKKCWVVGGRMIQQFDAQDSEEEESD